MLRGKGEGCSELGDDGVDVGAPVPSGAADFDFGEAKGGQALSAFEGFGELFGF